MPWYSLLKRNIETHPNYQSDRGEKGGASGNGSATFLPGKVIEKVREGGSEILWGLRGVTSTFKLNEEAK